jgi:membrane complex biogenesis BtpA family protein
MKRLPPGSRSPRRAHAGVSLRRIVSAARAGKLLLGVVHLRPLPGSPRHDGESIEAIAKAAQRDARAILDAGFDGTIVENFGDVPFEPGAVPSHTIAALTRIVVELPRGALAGVNVLRNDALGALAVAAACGLDFIRVNVHVGAMLTDQGILEGRAAETLRTRALVAPSVAILADVRVKHAVPLGVSFDLRTVARDTVYRGLADGLIVTGSATGSPTNPGDLECVREAVPDHPLFVGSGATAASARRLLEIADGIIVGTSLKCGGRVDAPVDPRRARAFVREARG